jgi:hypothetical protein
MQDATTTFLGLQFALMPCGMRQHPLLLFANSGLKSPRAFTLGRGTDQAKVSQQAQSGLE